MRIIAGEFKGRKLSAPPDYKVRPTAEKVREAIFSMIQMYVGDSVVIDLFAGTGSLGLEALSRGAKRAYFVDNDRRSISFVKENVKACGMEDSSVLLCSDYASGLANIHDKADIVFLDPPYKAGLMLDCLRRLAESDLLPEGGIVIAEHGRDEMLPEKIKNLELIKDRKYGKVRVSIYEKQEENEE
ncbi:MAG: 16S rRNA (guanine(966)-N(2))-methyltransferase RsmD [Anaerovoracaceae bacterium]